MVLASDYCLHAVNYSQHLLTRMMRCSGPLIAMAGIDENREIPLENVSFMETSTSRNANADAHNARAQAEATRPEALRVGHPLGWSTTLK
jgi:hypothetical protein